MLSRREVMNLVLDLYDEVDAMKAKLKSKEALTVDDEEGKVELSPMTVYLIELGAKNLQDELVSSWGFGYSAPKVRDDDGNVVEYEAWRAKIKPEMFDGGMLFSVLGTSGISFEDVMKILEPALVKYYSHKVNQQ